MNRAISVLVITIFILSYLTIGIINAEEKIKEILLTLRIKLQQHLLHTISMEIFAVPTVKKIEQYSREAIEKYFAEELNTKKLAFNIINTDMPGNKHFVEDYQLYTRSLIIAEFKEGKQVRWKNLTKVWNHLNDKEKFYEYVKTEIQQYLEHN